MNIICNLIPLLIVLVLCALWFVDDLSYKIVAWQDAFIIFVMPIYLLIVNIKFALKNNKYLFIHKILLMIVLEVISAVLGLWTWKTTTGRIADTETLIVINFQWQAATIIILLGGLTFQIIRMVKYFKLKNNKANM